MVPSNIILSHSGTGNQTRGIKVSSDTQTIDNGSSEEAIRAIRYQGNNETTVKILNTSLLESTRTKYSICIRQWESLIVTTRDITIERVLNFLSNLCQKGVSYIGIVNAKCILAIRITMAPYQSLTDHPLIIKFITGV